MPLSLACLVRSFRPRSEDTARFTQPALTAEGFPRPDYRYSVRGTFFPSPTERCTESRLLSHARHPSDIKLRRCASNTLWRDWFARRHDGIFLTHVLRCDGADRHSTCTWRRGHPARRLTVPAPANQHAEYKADAGPHDLGSARSAPMGIRAHVNRTRTSCCSPTTNRLCARVRSVSTPMITPGWSKPARVCPAAVRQRLVRVVVGSIRRPSALSHWVLHAVGSLGDHRPAVGRSATWVSWPGHATRRPPLLAVETAWWRNRAGQRSAGHVEVPLDRGRNRGLTVLVGLGAGAAVIGVVGAVVVGRRDGRLAGRRRRRVGRGLALLAVIG